MKRFRLEALVRLREAQALDAAARAARAAEEATLVRRRAGELRAAAAGLRALALGEATEERRAPHDPMSGADLRRGAVRRATLLEGADALVEAGMDEELEARRLGEAAAEEGIRASRARARVDALARLRVRVEREERVSRRAAGDRDVEECLSAGRSGPVPRRSAR